MVGNSLPRVVGIAGSLRSGAFSTAILRALADHGGDVAVLAVHTLHDLPLYDGDVEERGLPPAVVSLKQAIVDADAVVIASPEYLHGIPGVLKNALDWIARPSAERVLTDKPVYVITSSPAQTGGVRAQAQINEAVTASGGRILAKPQSVVPLVRDKVINGEFIHMPTIEFLVAGLRDLVANQSAAGS
jgi:chromate reductase